MWCIIGVCQIIHTIIFMCISTIIMIMLIRRDGQPGAWGADHLTHGQRI